MQGLELMTYDWVRMDLPKAPREVTRVIIRTVDTQEVEHMRTAKLSIYRV